MVYRKNGLCYIKELSQPMGSQVDGEHLPAHTKQSQKPPCRASHQNTPPAGSPRELPCSLLTPARWVTPSRGQRGSTTLNNFLLPPSFKESVDAALAGPVNLCDVQCYDQEKAFTSRQECGHRIMARVLSEH